MGYLVCHHVVFITKGFDVDAGSVEEQIVLIKGCGYLK